MLIVTRTLTVDPAVPASAAPKIEPVTLTHASATAVFIGIYREFRAIEAATQPAWIDTGFHPAPHGLPWSERGLTPTAKSLSCEHVRANPHVYEYACSEYAWIQQLPDSRLRVHAETYDPGFRLTWTVEVL